MKILELNVKVYVSRNVNRKDICMKIGDLIDITLGKNEEYLEFHQKNKFKHYCFNGLLPIEASGIYKSDNIYNFQIRTLNRNLAEYLIKELPRNFSSYLKVLKVDVKYINQRPLEKIYSITPVVIKNDFGYWKGRMSLSAFEERLKINLIKKYNSLTGENIGLEVPLFNSIEIKNQKPISTNYKNKSILGDKLILNISDDSLSQKIAFVAIGSGIGEINARGLGFVNYKWF